MGGNGTGGKGAGRGGGGEWICGIKYGQSGSVGEKCKRDIRRDHLHPWRRNSFFGGFFYIFFIVPINTRSSLRDYIFTAGFLNQYSSLAMVLVRARARAQAIINIPHSRSKSPDPDKWGVCHRPSKSFTLPLSSLFGSVSSDIHAKLKN